MVGYAIFMIIYQTLCQTLFTLTDLTKDVKGSLNGMTFQCDERTVMAADLLLMESILLPGTFIIVDGRTNNARFLKNNFQRNFEMSWDKDDDVTSFELKEERLGKYNILGSDFIDNYGLLISHTSKSINADLILPPSKSISNRALIIQALCQSKPKLLNLSKSSDTQSLLQALQPNSKTIDVGDAGTSMRFITAYLVSKKVVIF